MAWVRFCQKLDLRPDLNDPSISSAPLDSSCADLMHPSVIVGEFMQLRAKVLYHPYLGNALYQ